jgi:hypothetical protein
LIKSISHFCINLKGNGLVHGSWEGSSFFNCSPDEATHIEVVPGCWKFLATAFRETFIGLESGATALPGKTLQELVRELEDESGVADGGRLVWSKNIRKVSAYLL